MNLARRLLGAMALSFAAACGGEPPDEKEPTATGGMPSSGATCAPGSTLTYDNFASGFFASYCTRCHSSTLVDDERNGAPRTLNWDTLDDIRSVPPERLDAVAAAGPRRANSFMPPSDPVPSRLEREQLGEWLSCGTP